MNDPKYLGDHALITPDKPALIHGGTGEVLTYRDIDERSNRLAQCLFALGLRRGDRIAIVMENNLRFMEVCGTHTVAIKYSKQIIRFSQCLFRPLL